MTSKLNPGMYSSKSDQHFTPDVVLERVRRVAPIGLDPCANENAIVNARHEFLLSSGIDGLREDWRGYGTVFVNPPYSNIADWARKLVHEAARNIEIIALLPSRTDTRWMHDYILETATAVCFWRGRLKFSNAKNSAPFPSLVAYWGPNEERFRNAFDDVGWVMLAEDDELPPPILEPANDNAPTEPSEENIAVAVGVVCGAALNEARRLFGKQGLVRDSVVASHLADRAASDLQEVA